MVVSAMLDRKTHLVQGYLRANRLSTQDHSWLDDRQDMQKSQEMTAAKHPRQLSARR